jgi:hypothetical protein
MQVAENTPLSEPLYVYLSFAHRQDNVPIEKREPMEHKMPLKEMTSVKIYINQDSALSDASNIIKETQNVSIISSKEHLIELEFDNGMLNNMKDFRPNLPLIFKW